VDGFRLDRRAALGALAGAVPAAAAAQPVDASVSLGAVAREVGIGFGSAFDREIFADPAYAALIARQVRIGATENAMKFDWLRPRGPQADFTMADRLVDFSQRNGMGLRGTALIWNDWLPPWLQRVSTREATAIFDRHIDEVLGRYRGRMHSWDVVNEPFFPPHRQPGGYRRGPWFQIFGKDYVTRAFRRAAAADPQVKLVLNEAFCEQEDELGRSVRPPFLRLIDELKDAGVKLDAVGFQAHLKPHLPYDDAAFAAYLHEVARRGVAIYITELDVDDTGLPDDVAARDRRVADRHRQFLDAVLAVPQVEIVQTWHLSDKYSWYGTADWYGREVARHGGTASRRPRTHLYDEAFRAKEAWFAVQRALLGRRRG